MNRVPGPAPDEGTFDGRARRDDRRDLDRLHPAPRGARVGAVVNALGVLALVTGVALLVYLVVALLRAEEF
jgi:K+-transporting ATPase KdpF subunit